MRAADASVLALKNPNFGVRRGIEREIGRTLAEDGAKTIVLGCARLTGLARPPAQGPAFLCSRGPLAHSASRKAGSGWT